MKFSDWLRSATTRMVLVLIGFTAITYAFLFSEKISGDDYKSFVLMMLTFFFLTEKPKTP